MSHYSLKCVGMSVRETSLGKKRAKDEGIRERERDRKREGGREKEDGD